MFKRIINYSNKYFNLFYLTKDITDLRTKPQISAADISASILSMLFSNLGSLNKFNASRDISAVKNMAERIPTASTVSRAADSMDLDTLRKILKSIYYKARRSKMIETHHGRWIGIIDAHEICSSDICRCGDCSIRNVSKAQGKVKLNYFHRYTAFVLAGPRFAFMLDIEPIYQHEGELSSSYRLLSRVCANYPKAFEVVAGDGLYLNGNTFNLLSSHHKYAAAVLKDERRHLFEEAVLLSEIVEPEIYADEKVTYRVWDHNLSEMWDGYSGIVRVIKSEETKYVRHHGTPGKWEISQEKTDWIWVTNPPSVVSLKNVVSICHARWQIENKCFNEIVSTWNADHVYRHSQNAITAFILFLFIVLNIFNIFFARNIKDRIISTKSFLVELVKAEFLTARWAHPIPL